jgi:hypothetical protein
MDFLESNDTTKTLHSLDSPDLAPLGFFLFDDVKRQLSVPSFDNTSGFIRFGSVGLEMFMGGVEHAIQCGDISR